MPAAARGGLASDMPNLICRGSFAAPDLAERAELARPRALLRVGASRLPHRYGPVRLRPGGGHDGMPRSTGASDSARTV